ncbi:transposase [Fulvivirgaceae bacterium PWU5]|uniref:Mutator family transposase n=1 Tax=Dawidia cretensis TaxID=2782350 RepID=A0AAP2GVZ8_9BACT|nr:transposase [Dawidia cretensis]MBT1711420.1 transposase [Dawidia cretensis]
MKKKKQEDFDLEEIKKKALEQFRSGKSLYGKDGAFAPMLKSFLESALEGELDSHLDEDERKTGNRRNGKTSKTVQTSDGPVELETAVVAGTEGGQEVVERLLYLRIARIDVLGVYLGRDLVARHDAERPGQAVHGRGVTAAQ